MHAFTRLTAIAVLFLPAACSSGPGAGPRVPTLSAPATSSAAGVQRPQLRVDTSEADKARMLTTWGECLKRQGVPTYEKSQDGIRLVLSQADRNEYAAQFKACEPKEPVYPAALDPARNPHYADDMHNWVKCINRDSPVIKVVETEDGPRTADAEVDNNATAAQQKAFETIFRNCQYEAFGRQ